MAATGQVIVDTEEDNKGTQMLMFEEARVYRPRLGSKHGGRITMILSDRDLLTTFRHPKSTKVKGFVMDQQTGKVYQIRGARGANGWDAVAVEAK